MQKEINSIDVKAHLTRFGFSLLLLFFKSNSRSYFDSVNAESEPRPGLLG